MRVIFCFFTVSISFFIGGTASAMKIPSEVKEIVGFICVESPNGDAIPQGTGFFVGILDANDKNKWHSYLVTTKHVIQDQANKRFLPAICLRLNTNDGMSEIIKIPLTESGSKKNIFLHADPTVDLVAIPMAPNPERHKAKILTDDYLTSKEDFEHLKIGEGSDVFFTGLFTPHIGLSRNYPIVRFGRVALISEEKINLGGGVLTDLILVEASAYGGNSGSPVFYYLGSDREPGSLIVGPPILKLAGIVSGYFPDIQPIQAIESKVMQVVTQNLGITAVVPAYKLHELLFSEELKNQRK